VTDHPNEAREREAEFSAFKAWVESLPPRKQEYGFMAAREGFTAGWFARASLEATSSAPIDECRAVAVSDEVIELAAALEQQRAYKIVADVAALPIGTPGDMPTPFQSGYQLACEEIEHRLRTEQWQVADGVYAPIAEPQATQPASDATARTESAPAIAEPAQLWGTPADRTTQATVIDGRLYVSKPAAQAQRLTEPRQRFNAQERAILAPPHPGDFGIPAQYYGPAKGFAHAWHVNRIEAEARAPDGGPCAGGWKCLHPSECARGRRGEVCEDVKALRAHVVAAEEMLAEARAPISDALEKLREALEQHDTSRRLYGVHGGCEAEVFAAARALLSGRAGASASQRDSLVEAPKP
jgi:hypothetical protein